MGGHSKTHNWAPKLTMGYFNMNLNNTMQVYKVLMAKHNPGKHVLTMSQCVSELAHTLMQRGDEMRTLSPEHPNHKRDLTNVDMSLDVAVRDVPTPRHLLLQQLNQSLPSSNKVRNYKLRRGSTRGEFIRVWQHQRLVRRDMNVCGKTARGKLRKQTSVHTTLTCAVKSV